MTPGTLFVVATPLGNPGDLPPRALEALRAAKVVFAEDTRTAAKLLAAHGLSRPLRSCFDANEEARAADAGALLERGETVALVSEAGTPTVSDPGYRLVRAAIAAGARVVPLPGPAAFLLGLVGSGLATDRFMFVGFPPRKTGPRRALFETLRALPATLLFYESPHRVAATLADLAEVLGGGRGACVARELTKTHEEFARGTLAQLADRYARDRPLGEVTLVVAGAADAEARPPADEQALRQRARALIAAGDSARDAAQTLAAETGRPKRELYRLVVAVAAENPD